jgi:hypothetical protein
MPNVVEARAGWVLRPAAAAQGTSRLADRVLVLRRVAARRHRGPPPRRAAGPVAGCGRAGPDGQRRRRGLPVGQGWRHRRPGSRGFDAGKKVNGRKRHVVVDTLGMLLVVMVWPWPACRTATAAGWRWNGCGSPMPSVAVVWAVRRPAGRLRPAGAARRGRGGSQVGGPARLRRTAPPLGGRADLRLDQPLPPARSRLRAAHGARRGDGQAVNDRADGPSARPRTRPPTLGQNPHLIRIPDTF